MIAAVELISDITETYDDCVFDITGGDEMLVFALGEICGRNPDRNIQVHKFNLRNGKIYDGDRDGTTVYHDLTVVTVDENILIYGGKYSKKVLITTSLDTHTEKGAHIKQRARDMKINLIENVAALEDSDLEKILKNLWAG